MHEASPYHVGDAFAVHMGQKEIGFYKQAMDQLQSVFIAPVRELIHRFDMILMAEEFEISSLVIWLIPRSH